MWSDDGGACSKRYQWRSKWGTNGQDHIIGNGGITVIA
ncbi:hypothetical protein L915_10754 [Phytophthora nicotianae]|uniref:Uncharacterized protein n=1 Tax=Phytophthora nicotianae TaxID=4792 RepID=W2N8D7_PHYNI|nr:hypothetical protein L915_10754 [Phytophthora nicotianae]ETL37705.1 hypothetical protein L916_10647 [Phytophthora nicotianae]ETM44153.1 hypothetical protein L914_10587 [Phytophthora nicotianae]